MKGATSLTQTHTTPHCSLLLISNRIIRNLLANETRLTLIQNPTHCMLKDDVTTVVTFRTRRLDVVLLGNKVGEFDVRLAAASLFWSCRS